MDSNTTVVEAMNKMTLGNVAEVINTVAVSIAVVVVVMLITSVVVSMFSKPRF